MDSRKSGTVGIEFPEIGLTAQLVISKGHDLPHIGLEPDNQIQCLAHGNVFDYSRNSGIPVLGQGKVQVVDPTEDDGRLRKENLPIL